MNILLKTLSKIERKKGNNWKCFVCLSKNHIAWFFLSLWSWRFSSSCSGNIFVWFYKKLFAFSYFSENFLHKFLLNLKREIPDHFAMLNNSLPLFIWFSRKSYPNFWYLQKIFSYLFFDILDSNSFSPLPLFFYKFRVMRNASCVS